jgi:hypothetical protein
MTSSIIKEGITFYPSDDKNHPWETVPYQQLNDEKSLIGFHVSNIMNASKESSTPQKYIHDRNQYCIACGTPLDVVVSSPTCCGRQECLYALEEILLGDYVTSMLQSEPWVFMFHLFCAMKALHSTDAASILDPYPVYFMKGPTTLNRAQLNVLLGNKNYQDFERLKRLTADLTLAEIETKTYQWRNFTNDKKLCDHMGIDLYRWIRFIVMSPRIKLFISPIYKGEHMNQQAVLFQAQQDRMDVWSTPDLLYHGSAIQNWYAIVRHGLKSMSKTLLQKNGAAHGHGIYLSNDFNLSKTYSLRTPTTSYIMGLFQTMHLKVHQPSMLYLILLMSYYKLLCFTQHNQSKTQNN